MNLNRIGNFFFRYRNGLFPLAVVFVFIPSARIVADDGWALAFGLVAILAGQALRAVTIGLFYIKRGGRDRRVYADDLVTEGLFAHCRNPLYVGNYLMLLGFGLAINSLACLVGGGAFFAFAYYSIILAEEQYLRRSFGERFDEYCDNVPRLRVRLRGLGATLLSSRFRWRRLLIKEYGTFFNWTAGVPLALYVRSHLFAWKSFNWHALDGILLSILAMAVLFWAGARYLKKGGLIVAD